MNGKQCALDALRAARHLLRRPHTWIKGAFAIRNDGKRINHGADPHANQFCMMGAIEHVLGVSRGADLNHPAFHELREEVWSRFFAGEIPSFNDHVATTHGDVMAVFDSAIARLEGETGDHGQD